MNALDQYSIYPSMDELNEMTKKVKSESKKVRMIAQDIREYGLQNHTKNPALRTFGSVNVLVSAEIDFPAAFADAVDKADSKRIEFLKELQFSHSLAGFEVYK